MANPSYPPSLESALSERTLPSLDGLRALAAFLVVFYHSGLPAGGGLGVLMFFVLSGFLITWLLLREEEQWGNISLKQFYTRRTLRIFPAFYVFWLLQVVGFEVLGRRIDVSQAIASFFYVSNYYQAILGDPDTGLSHTWSLGVEEQFYLLWPLAFMLLRKTGNRARVLTFAIPVVWAYRLVSVLVFHVNQGYVYEALDMRIDHLLLGCLLAIVLFQRSHSRLWQVACSRPWTLWISMGALATSVAIGRYAHGLFRYRDTVGFILDPLLCAILIVQALTFGRQAARWMNWGWVRWLGKISYSTYLYQQVTLRPTRLFLKFLPMPIQLAASIVVCLGCAAASYYFVESPFLAFKDKIGRSVPRRKPVFDRQPALPAASLQPEPSTQLLG